MYPNNSREYMYFFVRIGLQGDGMGNHPPKKHVDMNELFKKMQFSVILQIYNI